MKTPENEITNNAVGRLHNLLLSIRTFLQLLTKGGVQSIDEKVGAMLTKIPEFKDMDPLLSLIKLINLTFEAEEEISRLPERSQKTHMKSVLAIRTGLSSIALHSPAQLFLSYTTDAVMNPLELTADHLAQVTEEKPVNESDIKSLQQEVQELLDLVIKTEFDKDLKLFLIENIERIRNALLYYRVNGAKGMKDVLEKTIGSLSIFDSEELKKTPPGVREKLLIVFSNFAKVASFLNDIKGLTDNGTNFPFLPGL